jgi:aerobic carbon-monoxide dehydrogenase large subunit
MAGSILGTAVRRIEDPELLTGHGTFVANQRVEGLLHAVFVRSPFAHARLVSVDTAGAAQLPGVVAVLTARDLGSQPVPPFAQVHPRIGRPALAVDKVRYAGDPVALVVAASVAEALDAAELVDVEYDELPVVVDPEAALAPDAPLQYDELGTNIAASRRDPAADHPDAPDADPLAGAAHVTRLRMENPRIANAPIEGHAVLAVPAPDGGDGPGGHDLTVYLSTQHPHLARDLLARLTGLPKERVRVIAPHVGGAFGGKAGIAAEHAAVVLAARHVRRPVAWVETRSEAMLSMQGRGQVQYAELGLDADGRFVGLRERVIGDCGAYAGFGGSLALGPTYLMATGPYALTRLRYDAVAVLTNTAPVGAFRGAGRPEAAAMLERLVDAAARELGLAPEELRRRNLVPPDAFPWQTPTGLTYDVGDYDRALGEALRLADVERLRAEQRGRRERQEVRQLGIGIAVYVEITGFPGSELGTVEVHRDGSATLSAGTSAHGQGHGTSFAMLVADRLGIPLERLTYVQSDTALVASGGGTGGSRSLQLGGNAVVAAAEVVRQRAAEVAAALLEAAPDDVEVVDGGFGVRGVSGARVGWPEVAARAAEDGVELAAAETFRQTAATFPFGAHVSVVEVDTETGRVVPLRHVAVDDCGRVLNPLVVEGQQHGGTVQGISQALWEHFEYDEEGTPITSSFADYALPSAADAIALEVSTTETPTPVNPLGAKGIGESATVGATPAVQNAVVDALAHLGVRHVDLPCTPERVWRAIAEARAGRGGLPWREPPAILDDLPRRPERGQGGDEGEEGGAI